MQGCVESLFIREKIPQGTWNTASTWRLPGGNKCYQPFMLKDTVNVVWKIIVVTTQYFPLCLATHTCGSPVRACGCACVCQCFTSTSLCAGRHKQVFKTLIYGSFSFPFHLMLQFPQDLHALPAKFLQSKTTYSTTAYKDFDAVAILKNPLCIILFKIG